jgi:hypothetical protein
MKIFDANVPHVVWSLVYTLVERYGYRIKFCYRNLKSKKYVFDCRFHKDDVFDCPPIEIKFPFFDINKEDWGINQRKIETLIRKKFRGFKKYQKITDEHWNFIEYQLLPRL